MKKVFISYARKDDEAFAKRLYGDLTSRGFDVWWDREALHSRQLTFHQEIKDAIRCDVEKVVYVAGPAAYYSNYVREEWLFALECDLHVIPILRMGDYDSVPGELDMYHCHDFRRDEEYQAQMEKLTADLNSPSPPLGFLKAVPNLPPHFIGRPDIMKKLKDSLLIDLHRPVVVSGSSSQVGIQGMGGLGKSVLAAAVARDRGVRLSYPDGVVWLIFGQKPEILGLMRNLLLLLGEKAEVQSILEAQTVLRELLLRKSVLIVLDDVWQASDAKHFDVIGPRCRLLITSRDAGIIRTLNGQLYALELFTEEEALKLLADSVGVVPTQLPEEAGIIVKECGCLPLAIALCGGMAKQSGGDWQHILKRLQDARLEKIADRNSINEQHISIWKAMQISVEAIGEDEQRRFAELSAFFTDRQIPVESIATLWNYTGHIDQYDIKDLIIDLCARSLINYDSKMETVSLHDLLYDYAYRTAGEPIEVQNKLLDAYHCKCVKGEWHQGPDDGYYYENLCPHFLAAGKTDSAIALLTDIRWISASCAAGLAYNLVTDYQQVIAALPEFQEELKREKLHCEEVSRYTGSMIEYARKWSEARNLHAEDPEKYPLPDEGDIPLPKAIESAEPWSEERIKAETERIVNNTTRLDRLRTYAQFVRGEVTALHQFGDRPGFVYQHAYNTAEYEPIVTSAKIEIDKDQKNTLFIKKFMDKEFNPFPSLLSTLEGSLFNLEATALTPDGKLAVSGGWDNTLRVWDIDSGNCLNIMEGHTKRVSSVALTPDGKLAVSGGWDNTLCVWDIESGRSLKTLKGHTDEVTSVAITPDGKLAVSGSADETLRVWDNESGNCLKTLEGHTYRVKTVAITPNGKLAVSGSWDTSLRVWDIERGWCLKKLEGHTRMVNSVAITPDGKLAISGGYEGELRVWEIDSGRCIWILKGHTDVIESLALTPDGKLAVSGSRDKTLRVWDIARGGSLNSLEEHTYSVTSVALTPDGKLAISGSWDKTLRVWDIERGRSLKKAEEHANVVESLAITPDGKLAISGSWDKTLRVWSTQSGRCMRILKGHTDYVASVLITPDVNYVISGSADSTLRLCELSTDSCIKVFDRHAGYVNSIAITPDGKYIVSGSSDETIRVWDIESDKCLKILYEHRSRVSSLAITPNGKLAISGSWDKTIRVWDIETGNCLKTLEGHASYVSTVAISPSGRYLISGGWDKTLMLWDIKEGKCLRTIEDHKKSVDSVAILPDGKLVMSGSWDKTVRLWNIESGVCFGICKLNSGVQDVKYSNLGDLIMIGELSGRISFFSPLNFTKGIQLLTAGRLWLNNSIQLNSNWDTNITALCQQCGTRFPIEESSVKVIQGIQQKYGDADHLSEIFGIPDAVRKDPGLKGNCPQCTAPYILNPFIFSYKPKNDD